MKTSFCITARNRAHHVKATLPASLFHAAPGDEFVLLDYGSTDGLGDWVAKHLYRELAAGVVVYARLEGAERFFPSHAKNVAHRLASRDLVCSLDADNLTGADFGPWLRSVFERHPASVVGADSHAAGGGWGRVAMRREDFVRLGGYDERMQFWGFEDTDLVLRAQGAGLRRQRSPRGSLFWLAHTDSHRAVAPEGKRAGEAANRALSEAARRAGQFTANAGAAWGSARVVVNFDKAREL